MSITNSEIPFIITAPAYTHLSAGIRVLHTLCSEINKCGRTAYLLFYQFTNEGTQFFTRNDDALYSADYLHIPRLPEADSAEELREFIDNAYIVYPEVIQANPLNARYVVRYILNNPKSNGYDVLHEPTDFIVTFLENYWQSAHYLLPIFNEDSCFSDRDTLPTAMRRMDCTYYGKGIKFGDCFTIPDTVLIDRRWPPDKPGLAALLKNTRYLFTWDLVTQLNIDAVICGAVPVVLRWNHFTPEVFNTNFGKLPYATTHIADNQLVVNCNEEEYAVQRAEFIKNYYGAVNQKSELVREFVREADRYFAKTDS